MYEGSRKKNLYLKFDDINEIFDKDWEVEIQVKVNEKELKIGKVPMEVPREYVKPMNKLIAKIKGLDLEDKSKELLNLISLKGIGRVRARALHNEGFKTINELKGVPLKRLANVKTIGDAVAKSIKFQIGESIKGEEKELNEFTKKTKKKLLDDNR